MFNKTFQGMQFFKFIFLARSWASDRQQLAISLASLGKEAEREGKPLCFMVYPEGTLISKDTRPQSKKFADKMGIVRQLLPNLFFKSVDEAITGRYDSFALAKINWFALQSAIPSSQDT